MLQEAESNFKREYDTLGIKISDMRMDNNRYACQLQKSANELTSEKDKILTMKNDVNKQLDDTLSRVKDMNKSTLENFDSIKTEYQHIKNKFVELSEFIKDVRFRKNLGTDVTKTEIKKIYNKITNENKKNLNIKQEIKEINHVNPIGNGYTKNGEFNTLLTQENIYKDSNTNYSEDYTVESYVKKYIKGNENEIKENKNKFSKKKNSEEFFSNYSQDKNVIHELTEENDILKNGEKYINYNNDSSSLTTPEEKVIQNPKNNNRVDTKMHKIPSENVLLFKTGKVLENSDDSQNEVDLENKILDSENSHLKKINKVIKNLDLNIEDQNNSLENDQEIYDLEYSPNEPEKKSSDIAYLIKQENKSNFPKPIKLVNNLNIIPIKGSESSNSSNVLNHCATEAGNYSKKQNKFKDKFPVASGSNNSNNKNYNPLKENEEFLKKNYMPTEINSLIGNTNEKQELAILPNDLNENLFILKKEFFKKINLTEQRINQIEYFAKKKLEELASQIKNYIPINFNAYIKDFKEKISDNNYNAVNSKKINQLNVENLYINENILGNKNFSVNVVDTTSFKMPLPNLKKNNIKTVNLNRNVFNGNNNAKTARNVSATVLRPVLKDPMRK